MDTKERYSYDGPVKIFGNVVNEKWKGQTYATSPNKAKSNLMYQYKKSHNLIPSAKVELPGNLLVG